MKARRGANKAAVAIAHHMIKIVYHILTKRQPYRDLGADYHLEKKKEYETKRAVSKLQKLGFEVVSKLQKLGFEVKLVESTA